MKIMVSNVSLSCGGQLQPGAENKAAAKAQSFAKASEEGKRPSAYIRMKNDGQLEEMKKYQYSVML